MYGTLADDCCCSSVFSSTIPNQVIHHTPIPLEITRGRCQSVINQPATRQLIVDLIPKCDRYYLPAILTIVALLFPQT